MVTYSQAGQDRFVLGLIETKDNNYFLDIGCWLPDNINNTLLLEQNGWNGISIDITNLSNEWQTRKTKFINSDALIIDYKKLFDENNSPTVIDYLNIDIEGDGLRYQTLIKVFESDREFKIITIEHDDYRGYSISEKKPQRKFLTEKGYLLLCGDVSINGNSFEDWWINPKYFSESMYKHLISFNIDYIEILNKFK
jgi:hypothetical protein